MKIKAALAVVSAILLLATANYFLGWAPLDDSPGAWRRATGMLKSVRSAKEELECFTFFHQNLLIGVRPFDKQGQAVSVQQEGWWRQADSVEISWRTQRVRHRVLDAANLSILVRDR